MDISDAAARQGLVETARSTFGGHVDILVNNVGTNIVREFMMGLGLGWWRGTDE